MLYTRLIIHNCSKSFLSATKGLNSLLCIMTLEVKYKITSANHCLIAGRTMVVTSLSKHPTILIAFEDYHTCAENRIKSGDKSQRSNDKIWYYEHNNSSFNLESSPPFTCKISKLGSYRQRVYKSNFPFESPFWESLIAQVLVVG